MKDECLTDLWHITEVDPCDQMIVSENITSRLYVPIWSDECLIDLWQITEVDSRD